MDCERSAARTTTRRCSRTTTSPLSSWLAPRVSRPIRWWTRRGSRYVKPATGRTAWAAYPAALGFYRDAVELWPRQDPGWPMLLFRYGQTVNLVTATKGFDVLTEARDALLAAGDSGTAAEAEILIGETFWMQGQRDSTFERVRAAEALVERCADHGFEGVRRRQHLPLRRCWPEKGMMRSASAARPST